MHAYAHGHLLPGSVPVHLNAETLLVVVVHQDLCDAAAAAGVDDDRGEEVADLDQEILSQYYLHAGGRALIVND